MARDERNGRERADKRDYLFGNQIRVLKQIKELAKQGYIVVMASHQPEQIFYVNAKDAMLGHDKTYVYGEASKAMSSENLQKIYNTDARVVKTSSTARNTTLA